MLNESGFYARHFDVSCHAYIIYACMEMHNVHALLHGDVNKEENYGVVTNYNHQLHYFTAAFYSDTKCMSVIHTDVSSAPESFSNVWPNLSSWSLLSTLSGHRG